MGVVTPRARRHAAGLRRRRRRLRSIERGEPDPVRDARARAAHAGRRACRAGAHLLDLGCGPGTDAADLAAKGYRVTAIDWSRGDGRGGAPPGSRRRRRRSRRRPARRDSRARSARAGGRAVRRGVLELRTAELRRRSACRGAADRGPAEAGRRAGRVGDRARLPVGDRAVCRAWRSGARGGPLPPRSRPGAARRSARCGRGTSARASSSAIFAAAGLHARLAARARPVRAAAVSCRRLPIVIRALVGGTAARRGSVRRMARAPRVGRSLSRSCCGRPEPCGCRVSSVRSAGRSSSRPGVERFACARCGRVFERRGGVWRFLTATPRRAARAVRPPVPDRPAARTGAVRRRPTTTAGCRSVAPGDPHAADWQVRRETYHHLLGHVLAAGRVAAAHRSTSAPAAAGSRIVSRRSAIASSRSTRSTTRSTGSARRATTRPVSPSVQADFDALPFAPAQFDLVVFNGSLHYAADTARHARARAPPARAGRRARRDGLADVPRRRDGRDGRRRCGASGRVRLTDVVQPGAGT